MSEKKVYIVGVDPPMSRMFSHYGWKTVSEPFEADLICFTGSGDSDVAPMLYDEPKHPETFTDPVRDDKEVNLYLSLPSEMPCVGVCRGAQLLNVLNGGKLFQHVTGHHSNHKARDVFDGHVLEVNSSHHQMMIPGLPSAELILVADKVFESRDLVTADDGGGEYDNYPEPECIFYEDTKCLCFQPHPEWLDPEDQMVEYFFSLIEQYLEN